MTIQGSLRISTRLECNIQYPLFRCVLVLKSHVHHLLFRFTWTTKISSITHSSASSGLKSTLQVAHSSDVFWDKSHVHRPLFRFIWTKIPCSSPHSSASSGLENPVHRPLFRCFDTHSSGSSGRDKSHPSLTLQLHLAIPSLTLQVPSGLKSSQDDIQE
jgi:hypothetical protein